MFSCPLFLGGRVDPNLEVIALKELIGIQIH